MAFIKDKERKSLVYKINQSYWFRRILISIEIVALIVFAIIVLLQGTNVIKQQYKNADTGNLSVFGISMLIYAILIAWFGIVSLILTFTVKSPKKTKEKINKLESSAISGIKVKHNQSSQEINKSRMVIKQKPKKDKK